MIKHKGVDTPEGWSRRDADYQAAWRDGVDAALASRADSASGTTLKITGWALESVRAFGHLAQDDPDRARQIVRTMSPRDRAVVLFLSGELSRLVSEEEDFRTMADRRAARADRTEV